MLPTESNNPIIVDVDFITFDYYIVLFFDIYYFKGLMVFFSLMVILTLSIGTNGSLSQNPRFTTEYYAF